MEALFPKYEDLFREILSIDSTSGRERRLAELLLDRLEAPSKQAFEVGDGTLDLLLSWGEPKVVFCTHMDTVPPFIPPSFEEGLVRGRGACDAKGQIISMLPAKNWRHAAGKALRCFWSVAKRPAPGAQKPSPAASKRPCWS